MASNFPNQIDKIAPFLDLTTNDGDKVKKYELAMQQNNFAEASKILATIENVEQKLLSASRFNQIKDSIQAVQKFYGTDVEPYILQKQNEWISILNKFSYIGVYSSSTQYKINNMVSFLVDGDYNLYIRTNGENLTGQPPTDTRYWRPLTIKGERGLADNRITSFYGGWVQNQTYDKNMIVVYNNKWWISLTTNIGKEPQESSTDWEMLIKANQVTYPIQPNQPLVQEIGELWFQEIGDSI